MELSKNNLSPEALAYELPGMWTDDWFSEDDRVRVREISRFIPPGTTSLLDAGCGNGLFLHYLQEQRKDIGRLCGAERSGSAIAHVQTEKVQSSIDSMPFADQEFDIVTSLEVLEHLPTRTLAGALDELSRIARRHILITVPYDQDLYVGMTICPSCKCCFNADYHVRSFNERNLSQLFAGHQFRCRETFFIRPRVVFHKPLARAVDFVRIAKHRTLGLKKAYPSYAICPSCGFQDLEKSITPSSASHTAKSKTVGQQVMRMLGWKKSFRWVGALFDRI